MKTIQHEFVEAMPKELLEGRLYVSIKYKTASHKCPCGCGNRIVTPIIPGRWKLTFDGKVVSLSPSIGNWGLDCRSHYWIVDNKIVPANDWNKEKRKKKKKWFWDR
jgi:hypothetical protein